MKQLGKVIVLTLFMVTLVTFQTANKNVVAKEPIKKSVNMQVKKETIIHKTVKVSKVNKAKSIHKNNKIVYDEKTIYLARLIQAEGLNQSLDCKIGIANVIINRHKQYTKNLRNLRRIVSSRGQFNGYRSRLWYKDVNSDCLKASYLAYHGVNTVGKATHFCNLKLCKPSWTKKFKFVRRINNTWFYYNKNI